MVQFCTPVFERAHRSLHGQDKYIESADLDLHYGQMEVMPRRPVRIHYGDAR